MCWSKEISFFILSCIVELYSYGFSQFGVYTLNNVYLCVLCCFVFCLSSTYLHYVFTILMHQTGIITLRCRDGRRCEWLSRHDGLKLSELCKLEDQDGGSSNRQRLVQAHRRSKNTQGVLESEWKLLNRKAVATIR